MTCMQPSSSFPTIEAVSAFLYVVLQDVQGYSEQEMKIIIVETNFRPSYFYRTNSPFRLYAWVSVMIFMIFIV